jgi:hypothetical protein
MRGEINTGASSIKESGFGVDIGSDSTRVDKEATKQTTLDITTQQRIIRSKARSQYSSSPAIGSN